MKKTSRMEEARKAKGWERSDLAESVGLSAETIARYERGDRSPKVEELKKIAAALGVSAAYLLEDNDTPVTLSQLAREWAAKFTSLPGGLFSLNNLVFVPRISAEYTAHCGGIGVAYGEITDYIPEDFEVIAKHKLGPIDPYCPPFAINTDGSSMVDFGIPPETVVIVNPAADVLPGNLVLVEISGNPVIKKIYPRPDGGGRLASSDGREIAYTREDIEIEYVKIRGKIVKADLELDHRP